MKRNEISVVVFGVALVALAAAGAVYWTQSGAAQTLQRMTAKADLKTAEMEIRNAAWQYGPAGTMQRFTPPKPSRAHGEAAKLSNLVTAFLYEDCEAQRMFAEEGEPVGLFTREGETPHDPDLAHPGPLARDLAALRPKLVAHRQKVFTGMTALKAAVDRLDLDPVFKAKVMGVILVGNDDPVPILAKIWDVQLQDLDRLAGQAATLKAAKGRWRMSGGNVIFSNGADLKAFQAHETLPRNVNSLAWLRRRWEENATTAFKAMDVYLATPPRPPAPASVRS